MQQADAGRSESADAHLHEAEQRRRAADIPAERRKRHRGGIWIGEAAERQIEQQQDDIRRKPYQPKPVPISDDEHDDVLADHRDAENLPALIPPRQPDVELAAADEAQARPAKISPICARIDMKPADENDRRAGHVDEQSGE